MVAKLPTLAQGREGRIKHLLNTAAYVISPSYYLEKGLHSLCDDIQIIPNGLNIKDYSAHLRRQAAPRLIWLRSIHKIYNPIMAVKTVALLKDDVPDITLLMIGPDRNDGSLAELQAAIQHKLAVADHIKLIGGVAKSDVPEWLNKGDIFLNTTNADNTPVSVLEAMACGLCVVSTDAGGIPYLLTHEVEALLVSPGDDQAMANAVRRILNEPKLSEQLSRKARTKARKI